jgi:hypothetical protein
VRGGTAAVNLGFEFAQENKGLAGTSRDAKVGLSLVSFQWVSPRHEASRATKAAAPSGRESTLWPASPVACHRRAQLTLRLDLLKSPPSRCATLRPSNFEDGRSLVLARELLALCCVIKTYNGLKGRFDPNQPVYDYAALESLDEFNVLAQDATLIIAHDTTSDFHNVVFGTRNPARNRESRHSASKNGPPHIRGRL